MPGLLHRTQRFLRSNALLLKGTAALIAVAAFVILIRSLPMEPLMARLRELLDNLGGWAPLVYVLSFICITGVLLPGWPLNLAAGAIFGPFWGGVLASLGSTSAAGVSFLVGRYVARRWLIHHIDDYPRLKAIYHALGTEAGWKVVAAVRLSHGLPFGLQNLLLGASPVGFFPYLLTTWLISLPGIFMFAYVGHLADTAISPEVMAGGAWGWLIRLAGLAIAALAVLYLARVIMKAVKKHTALDLTLDSDAEARQQRGEERARTWPWGSLVALAASVLLLGGSLWCYLEREELQSWMR